MEFTFIDLFAGVGGMRYAFSAVGGQCVLTSEIDPHAIATYELNFPRTPEHSMHGDIMGIKNRDIPEHDVLIAGFPCQPYSIAGLRKGLEDSRGAIFSEVLRILRVKKPSVFLLENVKGLLGHDKGQTYRYLESRLTSLGYSLRTQTLNSMTHANVPQNRERVFIVGFRDQEAAGRFEFPSPVPLTVGIHDLLESGPVEEKYFYSEKYDCYKELKAAVRDKSTVYQWRRVYVRENKSNVCPTLTANMGSGGHNVPIILTPEGIRKLTPTECAKFQGFPTGFKFADVADSHKYHQMGNSVTVPLIQRIAESVTSALSPS